MIAEPQTGIVNYFHCRKCLAECGPLQSPKDYARIQAGVGVNGELIIWCNRHEVLVGRIANDNVSEWLRDMVFSGCDEHQDHTHEPSH